jgi:HrpA-like RNA helicase
MKVRMDACYTADTRLIYCTTGILLRQLQGPQTVLMPMAQTSGNATFLEGVSHVVVDEVHEVCVMVFLMSLMF